MNGQLKDADRHEAVKCKPLRFCPPNPPDGHLIPCFACAADFLKDLSRLCLPYLTSHVLSYC